MSSAISAARSKQPGLEGPAGQDITLPAPVQGYLPTTFLERGVAVPFTTPQLAAARARPGSREPLELIVPNPSGAAGVYILPWHAVGALCRPTVHDSRLSSAVAALRGVTPAAIREAVRQVAAEGLAGRGALAAARIAQQADDTACLVCNFDLLLELVRQVEPAGQNPTPPEADRPELLELRARRAIALIAPALGRPAESITTGLEQLARLFAGLGVGRSVRTARIPAEIALLMRVRQEAGDHVAAEPDDGSGAAALLLEAADLTIFCARATLADAQDLTGDITALLRRWFAEPDPLARELARPDWLLDGWSRVCAIWQATEARQRGMVLQELAALVPTVPREAGDWLAKRLDISHELNRHRRKVILMEDWRTGLSIMDLIARNEDLLAKTL
jgi:hypothetical protein